MNSQYIHAHETYVKILKMTADGLQTQFTNYQERKEFEKYTTHLTYKIVQVIVQSRLGEKAKCSAKPEKSDWFNLSINSIQEVDIEAAKAFDNCVPCLNGLDVNVEVSVNTVDGDRLVLEAWSLSLDEKRRDNTIPVTHTVYNRMALLLKSLISVTRITPAYRFSREQGPECFVICYRVYTGESQVQCLGEEYERIKIGRVGTPYGTLSMNVKYRTKLTITPHKIKKVGSFMMVNSDYFIPEEGDDFEPTIQNKVITNSCHSDYENGKTVPTKTTESSSSSSETVSNAPMMDESTKSINVDELFETSGKVGAFAMNCSDEDDKIRKELEHLYISYTSSLDHLHPDNYKDYWTKNNSESKCSKGSDNSVNSHEIIQNNEANAVEKAPTKLASKDYYVTGQDRIPIVEDDFVLIEIKTPFASDDDDRNDLADFFHECRTAPSLQSFTEDQPTLEEQFQELNSNFAGFELDVQQYDDFVQSLYADEGVD